MKLRYVGQSFDDLTDGKTYEYLGDESGMYRIVDDSGEDYLYCPEPSQPGNPDVRGKFEIIAE